MVESSITCEEMFVLGLVNISVLLIFKSYLNASTEAVIIARSNATKEEGFH